MLGQLYVVICFAHQVPYQVFNIAPDIAGFAEFCGITFDKRDTDLLSDQLNHISLTHPGRPYHKDVVLNLTNYSIIVFLGRFGVFDTIEMGADLGSQNCLGLILLDDVLVKIGLKFLRL